MNQWDEPREEREEQEATPQAGVRLGKWSPWVWIIPAIALFLVGYFIVRYGLFGGGDITVRFVDARGLERYSPVRYRGAKVGSVQKISIDEELGEVVVRIQMDSAMNDALREGTRFWIVEPGLESGGLGGLLGGTYVGIAPGEGDRVTDFIGQEYAPIMQAPQPGKTFVLESEGSGGLSIGSPVKFEGTRVGRVLGSVYDPDDGTEATHVFVIDRFAGQVRENTRFWREGGFSFSLEGGRLTTGDASLSSLLTSGVAFYTPEVLAGDVVPEGTIFDLHRSRGAAIAASDGPHITYITYFPGAVGGLTAGSPVKIRGVDVGHVRDVRLRYVHATESLETPVILEVDPRIMEIEVFPDDDRVSVRQRMDQIMDGLVRKGLRATLPTSLLGGAGSVSLEMVGSQGSASLDLDQQPPVIPAAAGGSGIEEAIASLNRVATTIENLPLRETMAHMRSAAERVDSLVSDPALGESVRKMNSALTEIESAASTANASIGPIAEKLREAATAAESAASRAEDLIGSSPKQNYDLAELIRELTRAAEAVRALSSYLTEHPDSLLKGRPE